MPVPSAIADLSTTPGSNSPNGVVDGPGVLDDHIRTVYAFIRTLSDTKLSAIADGSVTTAKILDDAVTFAKLQNIATARVLGRVTAGSGDAEELTAAQLAAFVAAASLTAQGVVELATSAEVAAGTDAVRAITPASLRGGPIQSMVRLHTANGNGSTNTAIRRFSTVVTNVGSDITYADSATLGATFTIVNSGNYEISYTDNLGNANEIGLSLNSSQLTTSIVSITAADRLKSATTGGASFSQGADWSGYLTAGSVIRVHGAVSPAAGTAALANFTIARVS